MNAPGHRAGPPTDTRRWWLLFLLLAGGAALVYAPMPPAPFDLHYLGVGAVAVVATLVGIVRNRPARLVAWLLIATGVLLSVVGDVVYTVMADQAGGEAPFPSWYDVVYLSGMAILVAGGLALVRDKRRSALRRTLIDAGIVAAAGGLLLWITVGSALVRAPGATTAEIVVGLAYPVIDVALIGVLATMLLGGRTRSTAHLLLVGALLIQLVTDLVYAAQVFADTYTGGEVLDTGWLLAYVLIGTAALHPSMARRLQPSPTVMPVLSRGHLAVLWVPTLAGGGALMLSGSRMIQSDPDGFLLNLLVAVPIGLVIVSLLLWRIAASVADLAATTRERDEARSRELTLADVAAQLALADDEASVRAAVRSAATLTGEPAAELELHLPGDGPASLSSTEVRVPLTPDEADGWLAIRSRTAVADDALESLGRIASDVVMAIDRCRLASDLRANEQRFRSLVRHAPDAITVHDADGRLTYASPALGRIVGVDDEDELIGARWRELLHPDDLRRVNAIHAEILATPHATIVVETRLRHRGGGWRWVESRMTNLMDDPAVVGIVANHRDTTERQRLQRQLEHQATHDALTGLANRRQFSEAVREVQGRGHNAVIFLDLDRFKDVNDRLGHAVGDQLLQATAERIRSVIRPGDLPARLGGDEFAILLRRTGSDKAQMVAERVLAAVSEPLDVGGIDVVGTASVGVASADGTDDRLHDLLHDADQAMYAAKRGGRGRIGSYSPEARQETADRLELENDLRAALDEGGLGLVYEPVVSMADGRLAGARALIRWVHPTRGELPTSSFLPIAARIGVLGTITEWVVREACWQARAWADLDPDFVTSVDLPAAALHDGSFAEDAEAVLVATGLPGTNLALTIDASMLVDDTPHVTETLQRLRHAEVRLRLAGFGTANAPLDLLHRARVDELEVSPAFVTGLEGGPEDSAIANAVLQLAHSFGLETIALGVASDRQRQRLERRDCDRACGPVFGYSVTAAGMTQMLSAETVAARR